MAKKKGLLEKVLANLPPEIHTGDKVRLNVKRIHEQKGYRRRVKAYRDFVNANKTTVFTAHVRPDKLIELSKDGKSSLWLFWHTDLILVGDER